MRIAMASDHAGRALKEEIKALLRADGHEISTSAPTPTTPQTSPTTSTRQP